MTRTVVTVFLVLGLALPLMEMTGMTGSEDDRDDGFPDGGRLVYGEYGRPATLDPITSNDMVGLRVTELLFNGLIGFSPKNEVVAELAKEWSISADNRVYTFKLRDDIRWHDKRRNRQPQGNGR